MIAIWLPSGEIAGLDKFTNFCKSLSLNEVLADCAGTLLYIATVKKMMIERINLPYR